MSRGVNKVIILGNVGADPEVRPLQSGGSVSNLRVATSEKWLDKRTSQAQERTEWHRIVFYGRLSDIVSQYVRKGSKVYVEGSIRTNKWQDQQGQDRYSTDIIASNIQLLDGKQQQEGPQAQSQPGQPVYSTQEFDDIPF